MLTASGLHCEFECDLPSDSARRRAELVSVVLVHSLPASGIRINNKSANSANSFWVKFLEVAGRKRGQLFTCRYTPLLLQSL